MRKHSLGPALFAMVSLVGAGEATAYEAEPTHRKISEHAIELVLKDPRYGEVGRYRRTIEDAVVAEDEPPRFVHHFYDPTTGLGLPENTYTVLFAEALTEAAREDGRITAGAQTAAGHRYMSALEWALDGMPDSRDWRGAIEAYDSSNAALETSYEALGHVLHLVEDMAQPDHAECRPHPGNAIGSGGQRAGLFTNRVGYETLWAERTTWKRGEKPVAVKSLEEAFKGLATESRAAEARHHCPFKGDIALGLGARVADVETTVPALLGEVAARSGRFKDGLWVKFQLALPLTPTIPYPADPDERTAAYVALGEDLLPRAEEYGAGLVEFFYAIVNRPPFVQSVEISQRGAPRYVKRWKEAGTERHPRRRDPVMENDELLDPDEDAEVRIVFGPGVLGTDSKVHRESVSGVEVWVEPRRGAGKACGGADAVLVRGEITGSVEDPTGGTWVGHFRPKESGTLCIQAQDIDEHFQARKQSGAILDGDPSSPARAGGREPYEWTGYEAGPDRNHRFFVRPKPPAHCEHGKPDLEALAKMRWGRWTGVVTEITEGGDFNAAFGGHGKFWTTSTSQKSVEVDFRSVVDTDAVLSPSDPDKIQGVQLGHGRGTASSRSSSHLRYIDGFEEDKVGGGEDQQVRLTGSIWFGRGKPKYTIAVGSREDESGSSPSHVGFNFEGETCVNGVLSGQRPADGGKPGTDFRWHRTTTWAFHPVSSGRPRHVELVDKLPKGDAVDTGFGSYGRLAHDKLRPAVTARNAAGKIDEAALLEKILEEAYEAYQRDDARAVQRGWEEVSKLYSRLSSLWLDNDPEADGKYDSELGTLSSAIDAWRAAKAAAESKWEAATMRVATAVQESSPDVARSLLELAQKLKDHGAEAFGGS